MGHFSDSGQVMIMGHFIDFRPVEIMDHCTDFRQVKNFNKTPLEETGCLCYLDNGCLGIQFFYSPSSQCSQLG